MVDNFNSSRSAMILEKLKTFIFNPKIKKKKKKKKTAK